jgi:hypothetical protein
MPFAGFSVITTGFTTVVVDFTTPVVNLPTPVVNFTTPVVNLPTPVVDFTTPVVNLPTLVVKSGGDSLIYKESFCPCRLERPHELGCNARKPREKASRTGR